MDGLTHDQFQQLIAGLFFIAVAGGICGAVVLSAFVHVAFRCVLLIGRYFDRRDRIAAARQRADFSSGVEP